MKPDKAFQRVRDRRSGNAIASDDNNGRLIAP
jgi:hypothetical protein